MASGHCWRLLCPLTHRPTGGKLPAGEDDRVGPSPATVVTVVVPFTPEARCQQGIIKTKARLNQTNRHLKHIKDQTAADGGSRVPHSSLGPPPRLSPVARCQQGLSPGPCRRCPRRHPGSVVWSLLS